MFGPKSISYLQKSNSHTKYTKNILSKSTSTSKYHQIDPKKTNYQSTSKKNGFQRCGLMAKKINLSISTSPSVSKQITFKKMANMLTRGNHNKSFSINQSLNFSRINTSNAEKLNLKSLKSKKKNLDMKNLSVARSSTNPNSTFLNNLSLKNKKEEPLKLYTFSSELDHDSKAIDDATVSENLKTNENLFSDYLGEKFSFLDEKLKNQLAANKTNSKTRKYNTIKMIFEEMIQCFPKENRTLLTRMLTNYHEVFSLFLNENKVLKENAATNKEKIMKLEDEATELKKAIAQKDKEISVLKLKAVELSKSTNENESGVLTSNDKCVSSDHKKGSGSNCGGSNKNDHQAKIEDFNKNNYEDLDALYFYDKVEMYGTNNSNKTDTIPYLNLNVGSGKMISKIDNKKYKLKK